MEWLPILEYRGFDDVPRMMVVLARERFLLLDCPFDDELDDYPSHFEVYELPADPRPSVGKDWSSLPDKGTWLGRLPVSSIRFDATRRREVASEEIAALVG